MVTIGSFTPEEAQPMRDTTVVPESVPTSRKVSKTSSSTTSDAVTTGLSPEDFKLSSIISKNHSDWHAICIYTILYRIPFGSCIQ